MRHLTYLTLLPRQLIPTLFTRHDTERLCYSRYLCEAHRGLRTLLGSLALLETLTLLAVRSPLALLSPLALATSL